MFCNVDRGGGAVVGTVVGASIGCLTLGTVAGVVGTLLVSGIRQKAAGILPLTYSNLTFHFMPNKPLLWC